jgi:hypothetical protein
LTPPGATTCRHAHHRTSSDRRCCAAAYGGGFTTHDDPSTEPPSTESPGIPITLESLAGIWHNDTARLAGGELTRVRGPLMRLGTDGSITYDTDGFLDTDPAHTGTYQLDGDLVVYDFDAGSCTIGPDFRAVMPEEGRLVTTFIEVGDGNCDVGAGSEWHWIRVAPSSPPGAAATTADLAPIGEFPVANNNHLAGIWVREGSGQLLRFGCDNTYAIDDGGQLGVDPDDTGTYELDGDRITFTGAGSTSCTAGDTQVGESTTVSLVELHEDDPAATSVLHTGAGEADCPTHVSGDQKWLRLSP